MFLDLIKDDNVKGFILSDEKYEELKEYIKSLIADNVKLREEKLKYKRYVDETFLYTYEELQDKVIDLQKKLAELIKEKEV